MSQDHNSRDGDALNEIIDRACVALADSIRPKRDIRGAINVAVRHAYSRGINYALASEGRAWKRVNELEDVIVEIVRHAPGGALIKARSMAVDFDEEMIADVSAS